MMFADVEHLGGLALRSLIKSFSHSEIYQMYCKQVGKPVQVKLANGVLGRASSGCMESAALVEPISQIAPSEAAHIADLLWAGNVERSIAAHKQAAAHGSMSPFYASRRSVLLEFARDPAGFDSALLTSEVACSAAERGAELQPDWAHGAKIFVEGVGPEHFDADLCPRHVFVFAEDEASVHAALRQLPYNFRPRPKPGVGRREVSGFAALECSVSDEGEHVVANDAVEIIPYIVKNGFIDVGLGEEIASRHTW